MRLTISFLLLVPFLVGLVGCGDVTPTVRANNEDINTGDRVAASTRETRNDVKSDAATTGRENGEQPYADFDPHNFDDPTTIDNEWYPMKPGTQFVWEGSSIDDEGDSEDHRVIFTVTDLTKVIGGVRTVVCWDRDIVDGKELVESEIVFFAQDNDGAIWSLGEYPEEYEDDEFVNAPCWIHGVKDSVAGILIPVSTKPGTPSFSQGWAPAVDFTDRGVVDQVGQSMTVPFGSYEDVLVIDEWNLEEPNVHALKYYARGLGHIAVRTRGEGDQESLDLVSVEQLSPEELAQAREEAMKLEARAYEISKEVYAHTQRSDYGGPGEIELPTIESPKEVVRSDTPERKITDDQAKEIALKKVKGDVTGIAIERKLGKQAVVVEVLAEDGSEVDVIIDIETGEVLGTET